jgi:hypothetical protein
LSRDDAAALFIAGCAANQGHFYDRLDDVVLLTAPVAVMLQRVERRTTNTSGKTLVGLYSA